MAISGGTIRTNALSFPFLRPISPQAKMQYRKNTPAEIGEPLIEQASAKAFLTVLWNL
jgi:hypothetical protein